jgi:ABC-type multidrug transport system ATPase subunit
LLPGKAISGESAYALRDFSLSVAEGQMHALLGHNGAGKTTLMRIITEQLRVMSGDVAITGIQSRIKTRLCLLAMPLSQYLYIRH